MRRQVGARTGIRIDAVLLIAIALNGFGAREAVAAGIAQSTREYAACMRLARVSPQEGFESALAWGDAGGEGAAKHCAAVALFTMGHYREAAKRFEDLSMFAAGEAVLRAQLLAQAGQSWHQAGEIDRAFTTYSVALEINPGDPDILIDRAMGLAERGQYAKSVEDLNAALLTDGDLVDALVLRASAYRYLDALDQAFEDVSRVLELSPHHPEALLERGNILRLRGDRAGARRDWLALLRMYEGTPAADAAQRNLETLDVKQD